MSGRLITGVLTDLSSWRIALEVIGMFALAAAGIFLAHFTCFQTFSRQFTAPAYPSYQFQAALA
jgi:hypothetical protein